MRGEGKRREAASCVTAEAVFAYTQVICVHTGGPAHNCISNLGTLNLSDLQGSDEYSFKQLLCDFATVFY